MFLGMATSLRRNLEEVEQQCNVSIYGSFVFMSHSITRFCLYV